MPISPDDPPSGPVNAEAPPVTQADTLERTTSGPPDDPLAQDVTERSGEPRRRRRRRRRPPRERTGPEQSLAEGAPQEFGLISIPAGDAGGPNITPGESAQSLSDQGGEPDGAPGQGEARERPRRRRRRRRPPAGAATAAVDGSEASAQAGSADGETANGEAAPRPVPPDGAMRTPFRPRRRRLPHPPGLQRGTAEVAVANADAPAGEAPAAPHTDGAPPRRRRRRHPALRSGESAPGGEVSVEGTRAEPNWRPQGRGPRHRGADDATPQAAGAPRRGMSQGGPRELGAPDSELRDRGDRGDPGARGKRPGGRDGPPGRGRDAQARRVEQKLYTLESMVDRGFEDVPDEAEDSGIRRVHWTIAKRSVADQKSGKAMSTTYVLQREGAETEFPNLGAARTAANKTIVHPEKLTLSKAEHAAAKNSK